MTTVRLGMFETNSSSMHSIIIKKVNEIPSKENISNSFLYPGINRLRNINVFFDEIKDENYSRQEGRILIGTQDKLNLYVTLLTYKILKENCSYTDPYGKDYMNFDSEFTSKIDELNKNFFNKLGVNLVVSVSYEDAFIKGRKYNMMKLPPIEDSFFVFDKLLDILEDQKNLYSFLYCPESFVILAGDEYETAFALENMIKDNISKDNIIIGHLNQIKDE